MVKVEGRSSISGCHATRISVPFERNRKGSTQFKKGKISPKRKEKTQRKEAIAKRAREHQYEDVNAWTLFAVVFVFSLSACSIASIESRNTRY